MAKNSNDCSAFGLLADKPVTEPVQVVRDFGIVEILLAARDLAHDALAELPFLLGREHRLGRVPKIRQRVGARHGRESSREASDQRDAAIS